VTIYDVCEPWRAQSMGNSTSKTGRRKAAEENEDPEQQRALAIIIYARRAHGGMPVTITSSHALTNCHHEFKQNLVWENGCVATNLPATKSAVQKSITLGNKFEYSCHANSAGRLIATCTTDSSYPETIVKTALEKLLQEFNETYTEKEVKERVDGNGSRKDDYWAGSQLTPWTPELDFPACRETLAKLQDPMQVDGAAVVLKEIKLLKGNMEPLISQGKKRNDMTAVAVVKAEEYREEAKNFEKKAERLDRGHCCQALPDCCQSQCTVWPFRTRVQRLAAPVMLRHKS